MSLALHASQLIEDSSLVYIAPEAIAGNADGGTELDVFSLGALTYLLGSPHGQSSSLFINKEAGTVMKNVWNSLIYTGMFGPLYVG